MHRRNIEWIGLLSFGFFLITVGFVWLMTPRFFGSIQDFFESFNVTRVTGNIYLPAPTGHHSPLYTALMQICLVVGAFQIVILALRFAFHDSFSNKVGTTSGFIWWFGAAYLLYMLAADSIPWFGFIAGVIILVGLSIIFSSAAKLLRR